MRFCEYDKCKYPVFGTDKNTGKGYCRTHQTKRTDLDRRSIIQKAMAKEKSISTKIRSLHSLPANRSMVEKKKVVYEIDEKLEQWFLDRRNDMTGFCWCGCNKLSSKNDDKYFKFSACHLLAKSKFKSIMYHPLNFVELNFWEGHHTTFDNMGYEYCKNTKPVLWKIVAERFKILYPLIAPEEHKFIPQVLLETLK